jgi:cytochrome c553
LSRSGRPPAPWGRRTARSCSCHTRPGPGSRRCAAPAAPTGNFDNGRVLAYTCQGCHGITGYKNAYPSYRVPKIGGQTQQYLAQALTEYRQGKRRHPTMQAQSMSFSEQEIADLSVYLSTVK